MRSVQILLILIAMIFIIQTNVFSTETSKVEGKVIDETTGKGIGNVKILISRHLDIKGKGFTDHNGEFVISNMESGYYWIYFYPPEPYAWDNIDHLNFVKTPILAPQGAQIIFKEQGKNLFLVKKCKIGGVLELKAYDSQSKNPIEEVHIRVKGVPIGLLSYPNEAFKTNALGEARLGRLSESSIQIILRKNGIWNKVISNTKIKFSQTTRIEVPYSLSSNTRIEGLIKSKQPGKSLKDILVYVKSTENPYWEICYSNENGQFSMLDMQPGIYRVVIFKENKNKDEVGKVKFEKKVQVIKNKPASLKFILDSDMTYQKRDR